MYFIKREERTKRNDETAQKQTNTKVARFTKTREIP